MFKLEHQGMLIDGCTVEGETRDDGVAPVHGNAAQVARDRWVVVYHTWGFRGVDDGRSLVYQLRSGSPAGPVIKEGLLFHARAGWDPFRNGESLFKRVGHPCIFGVPKGALIDGKPAANQNVFAIKFFTYFNKLVHDEQYGTINLSHVDMCDEPLRSKYREWEDYASFLANHTLQVEWIQVRLNIRGDDIDVLQPATPMRQKGYEHGPAFCSVGPILNMNTVYGQPLPVDGKVLEWAHVHMFTRGVDLKGNTVSFPTAVRFRFNTASGLYEWVEVGRPFTHPMGPEHRLHPVCGSLARYKDRWLFSANAHGDIYIHETDDPFRGSSQGTWHSVFKDQSILQDEIYTWADGRPRLFGCSSKIMPEKGPRNPLFYWDLDPDKGFASSETKIVFDSAAAGLPKLVHCNDHCKILPHAGGREQWIIHRTRCELNATPRSARSLKGLVVSDEQRRATSVYHAKVTYDRDYPGVWRFD